jgi:hypothetical protein
VVNVVPSRQRPSLAHRPWLRMFLVGLALAWLVVLWRRAPRPVRVGWRIPISQSRPAVNG